jgi:two-component system alkaline phosphatase synthesis response regulator PhoP
MSEQKIRILAIDDERAFTDLLKLNLETRRGYLVRTVNFPAGAVQTALEFRPHVILLDVVMPEMDGLDVVLAFRAHPELESVPVIMITALVEGAESSAQQKLPGPGEIELISKPLKLDALCELIDRKAGRSSAPSEADPS